MSLVLTGCSEDDDDSNDLNVSVDGKIKINGVSYNVSSVIGMLGSYDASSDEGKFCVAVDKVINGITYIDYYMFSFSNPTCPKKGDNLAQMDLALNPCCDEEEDNDEVLLLMYPFKYTSGKAEVVATNPSESEITISFQSLMMSDGNHSYTFDGTAVLMFDF